jgi:dolichyl-phosphate-mannose--protein O-mannosyl transferase
MKFFFLELLKALSNGRMLIKLCLISFVFVQVIQALKYDFVTWTSTIKLLNPETKARLHSHDVKYGSGSGQQSVTASKSADDHNSYWQIKPKHKLVLMPERGQPLKCGDTFRLFHLSTKRNLHSHLFVSPLSNNQEVSAFGENGDGDDGDNWILDCDEEYWRRDEMIRIKHEATGKYLHLTGDQYGRPIAGQLEVSCVGSARPGSYWQANEGVFIKPSDENSHLVEENAHVEL